MVLKEKFKLLEEGLVGSYTTTSSSKAQNLKIRARSSSTSKFPIDCQRPATEITPTQMIIGFRFDCVAYLAGKTRARTKTYQMSFKQVMEI